MKKISILLIAVLLSMLLTGCSNASDSTGNNVENKVNSGNEADNTITIWHEVTEEIADVLQEELDKLAPEVVVKLERKESLGDALKLVGNDPSSAPDMYFYAHDKMGTYAEMGILSPITNYVSEDELADLLPMTIEAATYDDEIYQLPIYYEVQLLMYNKALMKEVPATTDELLEYMKENTAGDTYGFVEQYSNAYCVSGWMHAYDAEIIDVTASPGLNSQNMIDALTYHKQFIPYMSSDGEYNTVTTLFLEGKAHSIISGPWLVPEIKEANIDYGIAPMPIVNETGKALSPYSGVQGICVLKTAEDKKEAVTSVIRQLLKTDIGINLANTASCAPANNLCYENADVAGNEMIAAMKEGTETAVPMPSIPEMDVMWTVSENLLVSIYKNDTEIKTACDDAQKESLSQIEAMK
ncbi:MAG: extracellular solute-binding protein [Lachnospiraceae bacterium]